MFSIIASFEYSIFRIILWSVYDWLPGHNATDVVLIWLLNKANFIVSKALAFELKQAGSVGRKIKYTNFNMSKGQWTLINIGLRTTVRIFGT